MSKATNPFNPIGDLSETLAQFKLPGVDMGAMVEASRKASS
jgi:hypothetical protein